MNVTCPYCHRPAKLVTGGRRVPRDAAGAPVFGSSDDSMFEDVEDMADDWPYCECDEQTTEGEEIDNRCACCGKALR